MIKFLIILGVILFLIISFGFNEVIVMKNKAMRDLSTIDVFLKKRYDLIPNLVDIVNGYKEYEKKTLAEIVELRNNFNNGDKKSGEELNGVYKDLIALAEGYPELKASDSFLELQKQLVKVENEIQASRRLYVIDTNKYNTYIQTFPGMIYGFILRAKPLELLKFDTEEVNIKF